MNRWSLFGYAVVVLLARASFAAGLASPEQILSYFGCVSSGAAEVPPIDLLVDDSKSMRGFVNSDGGGRYRAMIDHLLETEVAATVTIRRLSATMGAEAIRRSETLFDPTFYGRDDTRLERAFEHAADTPQRLTILISDLEYSRNDADVRVATGALSRALQAKAHVLLIGLRSPYSTQRVPHCSPQCAPQQQRQFYLMIMSPSPAILRLFVDMTRVDKFAFDDGAAATHGPPLYYSGRPALEVTGSTFLDDIERGPWSAVREAAYVQCADQALGRLQVAFAYRGTFPTAPIRLALKVSVHAPIHNLSSAETRIQKMELTRSEVRRPTAAVRLWHSAREQAFVQGTLVTFVYHFSRPKPSTWDVYRIWLESRRANVGVPTWVAAWNQQSAATEDAQPAVATLVRTMIRQVTERQPLLEHYVVVGQQ